MVASAEVFLGRKVGDKWGVKNNLQKYPQEMCGNSLGYEDGESRLSGKKQSHLSHNSHVMRLNETVFASSLSILTP